VEAKKEVIMQVVTLRMRVLVLQEIRIRENV